MKRILISLVAVISVATLGFGASGAFFSDTETSTGNILQAGAIDLKVDNTCYYNSRACVNGVWAGTQDVCTCTWSAKDLGPNDLFLNLTDLKPGDWEEDTISLHVNDNNAWACMTPVITQNIDNGCTEPETQAGDPQCPNPVPSPSAAGGVGELASELQIMFWPDDGDNVLEVNEVPGIFQPRGALGSTFGHTFTLADSTVNNFEASASGGLQGGRDYFIGKGICFGAKTVVSALQLPQANYPGPASDNNHDGVIDSRDGGFTCDGSAVGNITQTDRLMADISFEVVQSRNNPNFVCGQQAVR